MHNVTYTCCKYKEQYHNNNTILQQVILILILILLVELDLKIIYDFTNLFIFQRS
jgi:hypothetical protein